MMQKYSHCSLSLDRKGLLGLLLWLIMPCFVSLGAGRSINGTHKQSWRERTQPKWIKQNDTSRGERIKTTAMRLLRNPATAASEALWRVRPLHQEIRPPLSVAGHLCGRKKSSILLGFSRHWKCVDWLGHFNRLVCFHFPGNSNVPFSIHLLEGLQELVFPLGSFHVNSTTQIQKCNHQSQNWFKTYHMLKTIETKAVWKFQLKIPNTF